LEAWRRPLYAEFYGLTDGPFELTPNPRYLVLTSRQREALSHLQYAMASSKGFMLMLGEAGTGKTTLVRAALEGLGARARRYVLVNNPTLNRTEFYELLARGFGLSPEAATSKTRFLSELRHDAEARFAVGSLTGLIIDEAQSMPHELLEEIRLLGNIETATTKLLNVVLCGQPELGARLNDASLRQLKQRIALRCQLQPLTLEETAGYISTRLRIAGGAPGDIFNREAVIAIFEASRGIPRSINVLCDNALISGFAAQAKPVTETVVAELCEDFDLGAKPSGPAAAADNAAPTKLIGRPSRRLPPADARPLSSESSTPSRTAAGPIFGPGTPPARRRFGIF
jgi:type II secretory pathway predicted ATPase ExeA